MKCTIDTKFQESVKIEEIEQGECVLCEGAIWIVTDGSNDERSVMLCNLKTGMLLTVDSDSHVIPLEQVTNADFIM